MMYIWCASFVPSLYHYVTTVSCMLSWHNERATINHWISPSLQCIQNLVRIILMIFTNGFAEVYTNDYWEMNASLPNEHVRTRWRGAASTFGGSVYTCYILASTQVLCFWCTYSYFLRAWLLRFARKRSNNRVLHVPFMFTACVNTLLVDTTYVDRVDETPIMMVCEC
jgi:hypothetical protein